uniref:BZIP domain-containing protein n=1 Tax=Cafeteria roenbergensis TaxID=33653 RepID=A0A7S0K8B5_CAFRO|mmetsp:Transcript_7238/g.29061  ORF Transcript_7238/g.29061 Transcript_7238/m.29061 type:complete len:381 (+) Transcript_7238:120-1262(+)
MAATDEAVDARSGRKPGKLQPGPPAAPVPASDAAPALAQAGGQAGARERSAPPRKSKLPSGKQPASRGATRRPRATIPDEELQQRAAAGDKHAARKMRNRESAALSRKRRRDHALHLEERISTLESQLADAEDVNRRLAVENAALRHSTPLGCRGGGAAWSPPQLAPAHGAAAALDAPPAGDSGAASTALPPATASRARAHHLLPPFEAAASATRGGHAGDQPGAASLSSSGGGRSSSQRGRLESGETQFTADTVGQPRAVAAWLPTAAAASASRAALAAVPGAVAGTRPHRGGLPADLDSRTAAATSILLELGRAPALAGARAARTGQPGNGGSQGQAPLPQMAGSAEGECAGSAKEPLRGPQAKRQAMASACESRAPP